MGDLTLALQLEESGSVWVSSGEIGYRLNPWEVRSAKIDVMSGAVPFNILRIALSRAIESDNAAGCECQEGAKLLGILGAISDPESLSAT